MPKTVSVRGDGGTVPRKVLQHTRYPMTQAVTPSEQFVYDLTKKTCLSLWSYVNPRGKAANKELCDVLVVCDPHVVVISVKDIKLGDSGNIEVDWGRWERKAIDDSVKQIGGAVRWLEQADHVIRKDGTKGLPLPPRERRVYHLIGVALGGSRQVPFSCPSTRDNRFVHVLDEQSCNLLLRELNTITDFTQYLSDKETFLQVGRTVVTGGEEDLLARYLHQGRTFPEADLLLVEDGIWDTFTQRPEYQEKLKADRSSLLWDRIIETFAEDVLGGYLEFGPSLSDSEFALRFLARETRFSRRFLGGALIEFLESSRRGKTRARCIPSPSLQTVGYVFLTCKYGITRQDRVIELSGCCVASIPQFPQTSTIVGIATETPGSSPRPGFSLDLTVIQSDGGWEGHWMRKAREAQELFGYFRNPQFSRRVEDEYPSPGDQE